MTPSFIFTNSIFCECFSITKLYTRIVERNNDFFKKNLDLPWYHLKIQFLRVSRQKKPGDFFPARRFFFVLLVNGYRSALIPRKLPCPTKFLVTHLRLYDKCTQNTFFIWQEVNVLLMICKKFKWLQLDSNPEPLSS